MLSALLHVVVQQRENLWRQLYYGNEVDESHGAHGKIDQTPCRLQRHQCSHHHGIMPYSVPPLMVLPEIVKAVNGQIPVFVDCGIVSGVDAFKALALGATAVGVGRELMGPLKDGGLAVAKRIQEMTGELKSIMARTGARSLRDIDPSVIHFRNF